VGLWERAVNNEARLVSRVDLGDHIWRFELRGNDQDHADEHPHFVCTQCGEVSCLLGVEVNIKPSPGTKRSAVGKVREVLLKGRCSRCAQTKSVNGQLVRQRERASIFKLVVGIRLRKRPERRVLAHLTARG